MSPHLDEFCTLKSSLMPSFCDSYSPYSLTFSVSLRCALCVKLEISVCVILVCICLFLCFLSSLSSLYVRCPLVTANHFWSISEVYGQFYPIIPASFQSLHHPSIIPLFILPQFEVELAAFHIRYKWRSHTQCLCFFSPLTSHAFYIILFFYVIVHNS